MKRFLFVTDTYCPDSSATTTLGRRTAEALAQIGYSVDVYPSEISGNHFTYPTEYNGVTIIPPHGFDRLTRPGDWKEYFMPVKASEDHQFTQQQVDELTRILQEKDYDCIFSVAIAFEVNFLVHQAIINHKPLTVSHEPIKWFPMAYDPYAFDPHVTLEQRKIRIEREQDALKDATKIFFLTEFKEDYIGSPIEDKIIWFMLPCIRSLTKPSQREGCSLGFDSSYINCVFLGDFYYGVENTDFIFRLFDKLTNSQTNRRLIHQTTKFRLYTVGNLCDFKPTVDMWKEKLGDRYICHERVSQEEAHNIMLDCDVLVSMGHDSPNMCPSKIIDFISSGKPILHIKKIPNCCGAKYLQRYLNKYSIYQGEELTDSRISEVRQFVLTAKNKEKIPFNQVKELYSDFTMEALIGKILKEIHSTSSVQVK